MYRFVGKRCLITGAASGIGRALVLELLKRGTTVAALDIRDEALQELVSACPTAIYPITADVTQWDSVCAASLQAVLELGGLDLVISSAGVLNIHRLPEIDPAQIRQTIEVHLLGPIFTLQAALAARQPSPDEPLSVAFVSSLAAMGGPPQLFDYQAAKRGLDTAIEALRLHHDEKSLRLIRLSLGFVDTPLVKDWPTGTYSLPFLITPSQAANRILADIASGSLNHRFPKRAWVATYLLSRLPRNYRRWIANRIFPVTRQHVD